MANETETPAIEVPRRKYPNAPQPTPPTGLASQQRQTESPSGIPLTARDEDDPRVRAAKRAAELRDHGGGEGEDDFFIPPEIIPDGWCYEWKRHTALGAEDPAYQVQIARAGWDAVPVKRHPEMMPMDYKGMTILRKGMVLMERPQETVDEAKNRELRKARSQVRQKEQQLYGAPAGENSPFDPTNKGNPMVKISKSYEPMPIPKE